MTNFTKTRLTDKGLALLAKEGVSVTITKVKTGNGEYQADENTGEMTQLKSEKQQFEVLSATKKSDTVYSIKFAMSNKELSEDYLFTEVGVYATDPDEGEILYAVCYATNENADIIRKFNDLFEFKAIIVLNIAVNDGGTVRIVSEGVYALAEDVQNLSEKFDEHIEDKNIHVTEAKQKKWNTVEDKVTKVEGKGLSTNDFTDEYKNKLNDMVITKEITGTLAAEETCITLTDDSINEDSTIDIYTSVYGVSPKAIEVAEGNITMTFKAQTQDIGVKVVVK